MKLNNQQIKALALQIQSELNENSDDKQKEIKEKILNSCKKEIELYKNLLIEKQLIEQKINKIKPILLNKLNNITGLNNYYPSDYFELGDLKRKNPIKLKTNINYKRKYISLDEIKNKIILQTINNTDIDNIIDKVKNSFKIN